MLINYSEKNPHRTLLFIGQLCSEQRDPKRQFHQSITSRVKPMVQKTLTVLLDNENIPIKGHHCTTCKPVEI